MSSALSSSFLGIWRSTFCYNGHSEVHHVTLQRSGKYIILQSLPNDNSYCIARLVVEERIATGSWEIQGFQLLDNPATRVWGALQLILDDDGFGLRGMWVGFGNELKVKSGSWDVVAVENVNSIMLEPGEILTGKTTYLQ